MASRVAWDAAKRFDDSQFSMWMRSAPPVDNLNRKDRKVLGLVVSEWRDGSKRDPHRQVIGGVVGQMEDGSPCLVTRDGHEIPWADVECWRPSAPEGESNSPSDNVSFTIRVQLRRRWVSHFLSMLRYMQWLGHVGASRRVTFVSDGDGDFRPTFQFEGVAIDDLVHQPPVGDEGGNRQYDAG